MDNRRPGTAKSTPREHRHPERDYSNMPTLGEKAALAGTSPAPSGTNKYVTDTDPRNTNSRTPNEHGNEAHNPDFLDTATADARYLGLNITYFLSTTASDIGGGYLTLVDAQGGAASIGPTAVTVSPTTFAIFATLVNEPNLTVLHQGVYQLHVHALVNATLGTKRVALYWELYKRAAAGGAETLLMTSETSDLVETTEVGLEIHANLAVDEDILTDDRLVVKVIATLSGGGGNPNLTLKVGGTTGSAQELRTDIVALDNRYAPLAKGVTGGDSHDHTGGAGAQIDHTGLSNIGTNTHAAIDAALALLGLGARVVRSTDQSVNDSTWTDLEFDVESFDTDTMVDLGTFPKRLTATTAGIYLLVGSVNFAGDVDGVRKVGFFLNNSVYIHTVNAPNQGASVQATVQIMAVVQLAAADYVTMRVYHEAGAALDIKADETAANFAAVKIA